MNMEGTENTVGRQVWGPWATLGFGLAVGAVFFVTQILVMAVFAAVKLTSDPQLDRLQLAENISTNGLVLAISTCATALVCVGVIFLIVKFRKGATISEYLGLRPVTGKTLLGLLALFAGFIILSDCLTFLLGRPVVPQFMVDVYITSVWPLLLWIALILAAPVFEETFFRGFLLEGFRRSPIGNNRSIVLTALAWTLIHLQYDIYEMATVFALGVLLGVVRIMTGSLWSSILMHAFCNLVATIETILSVHNLGG
jgi:membrane protease YdiL (CAAX protease family)